MFTGIITGLGRIVDVAPARRRRHRTASASRIQAPAGYLDDVAARRQHRAQRRLHDGHQPRPRRAPLHDRHLGREPGQDRRPRPNPAPVNLEKALRANDRLGGHLVSGHVDGIGRVAHFAPVGESWELRISAPPALARFLAYKGSITVNGVSLTVNRVADLPDALRVQHQPDPAHAGAHDARHAAAPAPAVNLEIDLIARYVERMLGGSLPRP